jgi:NAD-dependent SIR2 family protein deacetylase
MENESIARAAESIRSATAILITAGAGMGVDAGLPDFRGAEGFWNAYPPYRKLGLGFQALATPGTFRKDPALAWGFYGHRLALYRETVPHEGYAILRRWAAKMPHGHFVFTSNVDGHFARAGFDAERIVECHGSIHHLQCTTDCDAGAWPADGTNVAVDVATMRASSLPACPSCGKLARPNILLFGDPEWDGGRSEVQEARLERWIGELAATPANKLVIVECGAGTQIPSVRRFSEDAAAGISGTLVRINIREADTPAPGIGIGAGALAALRRIDALLQGGV